MDAFDSDVLIYAIVPEHPLGERVSALFVEAARDGGDGIAGIGSAILIPETMIKVKRVDEMSDLVAVASYLARLDLHPVNEGIAHLALDLGAKYGLKTPDAVHLATAVNAGADRFITNNRRDFSGRITEVRVTYPVDLPASSLS